MTVGAVVVERAWSRRGARLLLTGIAVTGLLTAPIFTPVLPAKTAVAAGLDTLNGDLGGMFGWPHVVDQIATVVHSLPGVQQRSVVIFTNDYSEAGAVDFYGPPHRLPPAISGHNTFWLWGYGHPVSPAATVVAVGLPKSMVDRFWSSVPRSRPSADPGHQSTPRSEARRSGSAAASGHPGRPSGRQPSTTTDAL